MKEISCGGLMRRRIVERDERQAGEPDLKGATRGFYRVERASESVGLEVCRGKARYRGLGDGFTWQAGRSEQQRRVKANEATAVQLSRLGSFLAGGWRAEVDKLPLPSYI